MIEKWRGTKNYLNDAALGRGKILDIRDEEVEDVHRPVPVNK